MLQLKKKRNILVVDKITILPMKCLIRLIFNLEKVVRKLLFEIIGHIEMIKNFGEMRILIFDEHSLAGSLRRFNDGKRI